MKITRASMVISVDVDDGAISLSLDDVEDTLTIELREGKRKPTSLTMKSCDAWQIAKCFKDMSDNIPTTAINPITAMNPITTINPIMLDMELSGDPTDEV